MVAQLDDAYRAVGASRVVRLASWALFEGRPLTTRGRGINPLVLALHHLHRRLPALAAVERPVFIVGMGRSGTTLLGRMLSVHPQVGFLNEPKALWQVAVGREDVVGSYCRGPARYRLAAADADESAGRSLRRLYGAYLFWTRRRRLVDKNPEAVYRVPFVRAVFPDARILLLVRDGWQVCRSVERWSRDHGVRRGAVRHDWWGTGGRKWRLLLDQVAVDEPDLAPHVEAMRGWRDQRQMAAVEWILAMRYGQRQMEAAPGAVAAVRYEELTRSPAAALAAVLGFCDLPAASVVADYARRVTRPPGTGAPFPLEPAVAPAFAELAARLGYSTP
jgi:hypothetical protein